MSTMSGGNDNNSAADDLYGDLLDDQLNGNGDASSSCQLPANNNNPPPSQSHLFRLEDFMQHLQTNDPDIAEGLAAVTAESAVAMRAKLHEADLESQRMPVMKGFHFEPLTPDTSIENLLKTEVLSVWDKTDAFVAEHSPKEFAKDPYASHVTSQPQDIKTELPQLDVKDVEFVLGISDKDKEEGEIEDGLFSLSDEEQEDTGSARATSISALESRSVEQKEQHRKQRRSNNRRRRAKSPAAAVATVAAAEPEPARYAPRIQTDATPTAVFVRNYHYGDADYVAGPLSSLRAAVDSGAKVKVYTRSRMKMRSILTGVVQAFDRHWNIVLRDVKELYFRPKRCRIFRVPTVKGLVHNTTKTMDDRLPKQLAFNTFNNKYKRNVEIVERSLAQLLVSGDQVIMVRVLPPVVV